MNSTVNPDLRTVLEAIQRVSSQEFGHSPDAEQVRAFLDDLFFGPRDLWPSLVEGLITPKEVANAVADRLYRWLLETFRLPSDRSSATDWQPFIAQLSTIIAELAVV